MFKRVVLVCAMLMLATGVVYVMRAHAQGSAPVVAPKVISLPAPQFNSMVTVEQAIMQRRSVRVYAPTPLNLQQVSSLLWAAQGITEPKRGLRTAPSAVATYPLRVFLIAGDVTGLPAGVYRYIPQGHQIQLVSAGDQRTSVGTQPQMTKAPALIAYAADYSATSKKFGQQMAERWAYIEAGHSAQNVLLEEVGLGMVGVPMGGFNHDSMMKLLQLTDNQDVLYVLSAGNKA